MKSPQLARYFPAIGCAAICCCIKVVSCADSWLTAPCGFGVQFVGGRDRLFDDAISISNGQLFIRDGKAAKGYQDLLDLIRWSLNGRSLRASSIVVKRKNADPLLIEALPIDGAA